MRPDGEEGRKGAARSHLVNRLLHQALPPAARAPGQLAVQLLARHFNVLPRASCRRVRRFVWFYD